MKAKICPICNEIYSDIEKQCPKCGFKEPLSHGKAIDNIMLILLMFAIILATIKPIGIFLKRFNHKNLNENTVQVYDAEKEKFNEKKIYLNSMSELSGLSKQEILEKRKRIVQESDVFSKIKNYSPNPKVYKIEDNLPWISAYEIVKNGVKSEKLPYGPSRHSMMINNPEILLGYIVPDYHFDNYKQEPDEIDYFFPRKVTWDEENKTIRAYFNYREFVKRHGYSRIKFYTDDTNARDFGFNWIYCDKRQGIAFESKENISNMPYEIKGYYHRGYSCGLPEGCNNYSPLQNYMVFDVTSINSYAKFKFWKNKPLITSQKADIYYEMYFE